MKRFSFLFQCMVTVLVLASCTAIFSGCEPETPASAEARQQAEQDRQRTAAEARQQAEQDRQRHLAAVDLKEFFYITDERTDPPLCFAVYDTELQFGFTLVPCLRVEHLLVND